MLTIERIEGECIRRNAGRKLGGCLDEIDHLSDGFIPPHTGFPMIVRLGSKLKSQSKEGKLMQLTWLKREEEN